jgi:6-phosphogluconolactonase
MTHLEIFESPDAMTGAAATLFAAQAAEAVSARGRFTAALSGGKTPVSLYARLAAAPIAGRIPWDRVHLLWSDERCVPPDHAESNYRLVRELLIDRVPIPAANVHRMRGEADPEEAAARYEALLRERFSPDGGGAPDLDFVLLGLGEDGHTASLFPGTAAVRETSRWVVGHCVDERKGWRITLTPPAINAARLVVFIAAGPGKAAVVRDILKGPFQPDRLPAQAVRPADGRLLWLLDRQAANLLSRHGKDIP